MGIYVYPYLRGNKEKKKCVIYYNAAWNIRSSKRKPESNPVWLSLKNLNAPRDLEDSLLSLVNS